MIKGEIETEAEKFLTEKVATIEEAIQEQRILLPKGLPIVQIFVLTSGSIHGIMERSFL